MEKSISLALVDWLKTKEECTVDFCRKMLYESLLSHLLLIFYHSDLQKLSFVNVF